MLYYIQHTHAGEEVKREMAIELIGIVRHANAPGAFLSSEGIEQAQRIAQIVACIDPQDEFWGFGCSDTWRAIQTALVIAQAVKHRDDSVQVMRELYSNGRKTAEVVKALSKLSCKRIMLVSHCYGVIPLIKACMERFCAGHEKIMFPWEGRPGNSQGVLIEVASQTLQFIP